VIVSPSRAKHRRNADLRRRRERQRESLRTLARRFGVSVTRVVEILDATGGDPLRFDFSRHSEDDLRRMCDRLADRIGSDLRLFVNAQDELESRRVDRINGLAG
jgi:transcriptional regulator with XRE-family HTH domain